MEVDKLELMKDCVDVFQIGARNMQNFPLISKTAKYNKPIILKRHFGCSIRDLLGSSEYALVEKNQNIILCERGVSAPHTHKSTSRFMLDIQAIPALKDYSCLPIISDPSHACFWHEWVEPDSRIFSGRCRRFDDRFHPDPRNAAVDPLQAINFEEFNNLVKKLKAIGSLFNKTIL